MWRQILNSCNQGHNIMQEIYWSIVYWTIVLLRHLHSRSRQTIRLKWRSTFQWRYSVKASYHLKSPITPLFIYQQVPAQYNWNFMMGIHRWSCRIFNSVLEIWIIDRLKGSTEIVASRHVPYRVQWSRLFIFSRWNQRMFYEITLEYTYYTMVTWNWIDGS